MIRDNNKRKVCMLVFNNLEYDPRVFKSAVALSEKGYLVDILAEKNANKFTIRSLAQHAVLKRIFPYPFVISQPHTWLMNFIKLMSYAMKNTNRISYIHCNDAETLPFGFLLKIFNRKAKVIYDAHEYIKSYLPLPKQFTKKIGFWATFQLYALFEKLFIKKVDVVISVAESLVERLRQDYDLKCKVLTIYNSLEPNDRASNYLTEIHTINKDKKIIVFTGALDPSREIENLIHILRYLGEEYCLVLLGKWTSSEYRSKVHTVIKDQSLSGQIFEDFIPYEDLTSVISPAAFSIFISRPATITLKYSMPNKFWESIAAGVPFVANSELLEITKFINKYRIGIVVNTRDPKQIGERIKAVLNSDEYTIMKQNIRKIQSSISWDQEKLKLVNVYQELEMV